jgi:hypothetical protein
MKCVPPEGDFLYKDNKDVSQRTVCPARGASPSRHFQITRGTYAPKSRSPDVSSLLIPPLLGPSSPLPSLLHVRFGVIWYNSLIALGKNVHVMVP